MSTYWGRIPLLHWIGAFDFKHSKLLSKRFLKHSFDKHGSLCPYNFKNYMSKKRFDLIRKCICLAKNNFPLFINLGSSRHGKSLEFKCAKVLVPSWILCLDETMSSWHPMYIYLSWTFFQETSSIWKLVPHFVFHQFWIVDKDGACQHIRASRRVGNGKVWRCGWWENYKIADEAFGEMIWLWPLCCLGFWLLCGKNHWRHLQKLRNWIQIDQDSVDGPGWSN